jgi:hypothetical protein
MFYLKFKIYLTLLKTRATSIQYFLPKHSLIVILLFPIQSSLQWFIKYQIIIMWLLQLSIIRKTMPLSLPLILLSISPCLVPPLLFPFFQNIHNFITIIHHVFFCSCNFKLSYSMVNKMSDRQTTSASIRGLLVNFNPRTALSN